jgi:hypothetical protein
MNKSYLNSEKNITTLLKPSTAIRFLLMVLCLTTWNSFGQCTFPGGATSIGTYTFCIDNSNTITTANVNAGQYALLNVVKGYKYTFAVGDVFNAGNDENLTVFDMSNTILIGNKANTGYTISNWISTISGQVKILLSKGACLNDGSSGGTLSLTLNSLGNTQDSPTAFGTDSWIGHVYNANSLLPANYAGYYTESESFYQDFSGGGAAVNNYCFPVLSNSTNLVNIDTDSFSVRYRMRSTKPAGCYVATFKSDDGIRLYVDSVLKYDNWTNHAIQTAYAMTYLNGNSDLIYEYYENTGLSQVGFSMTPLASLNTVTQPTLNVCTPSSSFIDGSSFSGYGFTAGTVTYQWKTSTSSTGPFVDCGGTSTNEDYTVSPAVVATSGNVTNYYMRVITSNANAGCVYNSNVISITTSPATPATPATITGSATQCAGNTLQTYSIAAVANATSYNWTLPSNWTITAGTGTNSITVSIASNGASGNVSVNAANGCGASGSSSLPVTLNNLITPTGSSVQFFCSGNTVANLSASGTAIQWYSASSGGSPLASTTALVNATHYYATQTQSGCETTTRLDVTATLTAAPSAPTIGTITQPTCTTATGSVVLNGLPSGSWTLTRIPGSVTTTGAGTSTTIAGLAAGTTYTYSVNNLNNGLKGEYFNNMTLTGSPVLTRTDATVGFDWTTGSPDPSINVDIFSVRWSGLVQPLYSETYTFSTISDDGIRLWVNGVQIINNWTNHAATTNTGTIALIAGVKYDIVLEYYENTGSAVSKLSWSSTSQASQIIPQSQLYFGASCSSPASANVVVNVQPVTPSTPTVGTITQPTCAILTGSVVLSGLPASGTINQTGTATNSYSITGTTMTISGLAVGTYNFAASNGSCTSSSTGNVVISSAVTKTWNGTSWSPSVPSSNDLAIINGNYSTSSNGDLNACSLTINSGFTLTIEAGKFVIIQNNLDIKGILDVLDKGSLVMVNDLGVVTNTGTTNIHRFTTSFKQYDYTYWSTPIISTTIATTFPTWNTGYAYEYLPANFFDGNGDNVDDDNNDWSFVSAMAPAKGYIIMVPTPTTGPGSNNPSEVVFSGKVNNGVQKVTGVITGGTYLLGNPYPSALDADAFLSYNAGAIDGTLYFWTHNTAMQLASGIGAGKAGYGRYAYTSDDYASYNGVGGTATAAAISGGVIPTGKIASCQGFFATTNATIVGANEIVFNNSMRLGSGGTTLSNSQFFKTKRPKGTIEKNRIWLNLSNEEGAFKQTLLGYVTGATNDNEGRFDGESYDGNEYIDFYSVNQDKNLVIQGRALPFDDNDQVPLGYSTYIEGAFNINIEQVDGVLTNQDVFIEDKLTNTEFNLKNGNYTFNTEVGTFNDRFVLKYKPSSKTLGIEDFDAQGNKVLVAVKYKQIKVNSFAETIKNVVVYDLLGRQLYQKENVNSNELVITDFVSSNQALIVKTTLQNGTIATNKIVF